MTLCPHWAIPWQKTPVYVDRTIHNGNKLYGAHMGVEVTYGIDGAVRERCGRYITEFYGYVDNSFIFPFHFTIGRPNIENRKRNYGGTNVNESGMGFRMDCSNTISKPSEKRWTVRFVILRIYLPFIGCIIVGGIGQFVDYRTKKGGSVSRLGVMRARHE